MARDILGPQMKALGFRRSGRVFWRDGPDVCHVVTLAMNRWGSSARSSFGVLLGVFWRRVEAVLENPSAVKMPPPENRCTFMVDLGRIISMPPKPEWRVTRASKIDAIGAEVWRDLQEFGFDWLAYRSDLKRSREWKRYATPEGDGTHAVQELISQRARVVFKLLLGRKASAVADLKQWARNGSDEDALKLARKLRLPRHGIARMRG